MFSGRGEEENRGEWEEGMVGEGGMGKRGAYACEFEDFGGQVFKNGCYVDGGYIFTQMSATHSFSFQISFTRRRNNIDNNNIETQLNIIKQHSKDNKM